MRVIVRHEGEPKSKASSAMKCRVQTASMYLHPVPFVLAKEGTGRGTGGGEEEGQVFETLPLLYTKGPCVNISS